jgi:thioredoxin 1
LWNDPRNNPPKGDKIIVSERLIALIIVVLLMGVIWGGWQLYKAWLRVRLQKSTPQPDDTVPKLLFFTTPYCAVCRTKQSGVVEELEQELGETVKVIKIDADDQPELAKQYGVITIPSTFVIDAKGQIRAINHGFASIEKLRGQFQQVISTQSA